MRILLLADIHANWPALSAIRETFDVCLFLGDVVDYGADAARCIDWVRQTATIAVRGNHDHAVAHRVNARVGPGLRSLAAATRELHRKMLSNSQIKYLARLPVTRIVELDGRRFHLVHATPRDPLDEHLADDLEGWRQRLQDVEADFVCVGHTHIQFQLNLGRCRVINPGSVGQPRDGDPRCAYAVIDNGRIELKRVPYDIAAAVGNLRDAGVEDAIVDYAERILRTGGFPDDPLPKPA